MIVGCYVLDLYCDKESNHNIISGNYYLMQPHDWILIANQFTGETYGECVKQARKNGWLVNRNKDKCLCKYCR